MGYLPCYWTVWPIAFVYHVLNWIINDAVSVLDFLLPASSLRSLTLGKANCHVMKALWFPRERPTWQGTEVSVQKPAKNWDLTAVTGMSLAVNSSVSVKPWDNCFPANSLPENSWGILDSNYSAKPPLQSVPHKPPHEIIDVGCFKQLLRVLFLFCLFVSAIHG